MSDLIDRQDAIDYFVTNIGVVDADGYAVDDYDERVKIWTERFSGIPTVEPEWKKGEWKYGENEAGHDGYFCSECETFIPWYYEYYHSAVDMIFDYKFCPNCGADMRGEHE